MVKPLVIDSGKIRQTASPDTVVVPALTINDQNFPATDGSNNQILRTDGSGTLYWTKEGPTKCLYYPLGRPWILDLTTIDADLKGFAGGFTDGRYGYFVPWNNGTYFGKVVRIDLNDFSTVSVLDLTTTDADLKGFFGGFTDGRYGYFVPS